MDGGKTKRPTLTKRLCLSLALVAVATLLVVVPVLAAYYVYIITENTGTDYEKLALNLTLDVDYLVSEGYVSPSGLDTRVTDSSYLVLPHMMADDKVMWVSDLEGNKTTQFIFWTEQAALDSMPVIAGHGGYVTITDNATLEPGDVYAFGIMGYVDTAAGADKNIIRKDSAVTFNVSAAGNLTFSVYGGNSLTASGVTSGFMTIMVYCDGFELWMEIGEVEQDRVAASAIPDTANNWTLFENDVMPYVSYYGEWVVP